MLIFIPKEEEKSILILFCFVSSQNGYYSLKSFRNRTDIPENNSLKVKIFTFRELIVSLCL